MIQSFSCPHCGAALEYDGGETSMRCSYCNNTVMVPAELLQAAAVSATNQSLKALSPWVKFLLIFIIVVTVVPTCIGIIATLIGVAVGIGAPILSIFLSFILGQ